MWLVHLKGAFVLVNEGLSSNVRLGKGWFPSGRKREGCMGCIEP